VLCDLDGVVWLAHEPIPGAVDAIDRLRAAGRRVLFVTNNSAARVAEHEAVLAAIGVVAAGDVISSSMAAASLVTAGERVLVAGGPGVVEAVEAAGAFAIRNDGSDLDVPVDAVVVGLHRDFDYARLRVAGRAVLDGARLIGTNRDSTFPTTRGLEPGGGSIVAAVATVGGVDPIFAGKPEQPMADLVLELVGASPNSMLMVGDRPDTDGLFADRIGCAFALVESGVTPVGHGTHTDLAAVVSSLD
jgi:HAD superfamily hydrolase (TIGR01450 family)